MDLGTTHVEYKISTGHLYQVVEACRKTMGDNNPYQPYHLRPWVSSPGGGLYIRRDVISETPSLLTFLLLKTRA